MSPQARRLLTVAYSALVAAVTIVYMAVSVVAPAMWAVMGPAGVRAVLVGTQVRRPAHRRPWWVLAAGLLTFIAGDTYYFVMEEYLRASDPFPSPADACYLAMYSAGTMSSVPSCTARRCGYSTTWTAWG
ncbi:hypothetical protein ACIGAN_34950 [Streptomyces sp. NPDC085931]|uniref:hypothetical protein n=1 Tax=Streptomyces sp. NPDC085931 TaxID=3365740 RepID=UPI0037D0CC25